MLLLSPLKRFRNLSVTHVRSQSWIHIQIQIKAGLRTGTRTNVQAPNVREYLRVSVAEWFDADQHSNIIPGLELTLAPLHLIVVCKESICSRSHGNTGTLQTWISSLMWRLVIRLLWTVFSNFSTAGLSRRGFIYIPAVCVRTRGMWDGSRVWNMVRAKNMSKSVRNGLTFVHICSSLTCSCISIVFPPTLSAVLLCKVMGVVNLS